VRTIAINDLLSWFKRSRTWEAGESGWHPGTFGGKSVGGLNVYSPEDNLKGCYTNISVSDKR
jgi:hypothetical protein